MENKFIIKNFNDFTNSFFNYKKKNEIDIYNEFSFQHELGIFIKNNFPEYKVEFERNVSFFEITEDTIKKEIDISVFSPDKKEKYAIELKFPRNGQVPEQMYSFVKDIRFMEELKHFGFTNTYTIVLVDNPQFYSGKSSGIYKIFRDTHQIDGKILKPTANYSKSEFIELQNSYTFNWNKLDDNQSYLIVSNLVRNFIPEKRQKSIMLR